MSAVGEAAGLTKLGRYQLITRIGQGGMAEVQLALQRGPAGFEKLVVVKLVHTNLASQRSFVDMLLDEARVAALVKHPNVVDIYDLGEADGRFFIAMEYLEGEPLLAVLRAGREGKRLDPMSTGRLIADTAEGLDAAHELRNMAGTPLELVHHDISLGNIVVLYNGQVKLVDFGVAKATQSAQQDTKIQGKFAYMAPEKLKGRSGDRRSDLFSLGCVMWEALTLKRLFRGGNDTDTMKQVLETTISPPSKVNGDLPSEFDPIVMKALQREPGDRYATAKELAVDIEEVLRKGGYGGKNDRIAKYMQETFKGHIDARKKLVQEVVSKGSASAEVVDAAFDAPVLASGSPAVPQGTPSGDLSAAHRQAAAAVTPARGDASKPARLGPAPAFAKELGSSRAGAPGAPAPAAPAASAVTAATDATTSAATDAAATTAAATTAAATTAAATTAASASEASPVAPVLTSAAPSGLSALLADRRKRTLVLAVGGAVLATAALLSVLGASDTPPGGGSEIASGNATVAVGAPDAGSAANAAVDRPLDASVDAVAEDAADASTDAPAADDAGAPSGTLDNAAGDERGSGDGSGAASDGTSGSAATGSGQTGTLPGEGSGTRPQVSKPPPAAINVEQTVQDSVRALVKGDARAALGLLVKARAARPGYAPTYRVLGRVHLKLGNKAEARKAFQRYLSLAPDASDAAQIKEELAKL